MTNSSIQIEPRVKVLFIDDVEDIRNLASIYISRSGYDVVTAKNGAHGLELYQNDKPDIVMTDLSMGPIGGLEVLQAIHRNNRNTPIIILTGYENFEDAKNALKLGAYDFLNKKDALSNHNLLIASIRRAEQKLMLERENTKYNHQLEAMVRERTLELQRRTTELEIRTRELEEQKYELDNVRTLSNRERARSEKFRFDAMQKMQYSERKYKTLIEKSPNGIATINQGGIITSANASFASILGFDSPLELVNSKVHDIENISRTHLPDLVIECLENQCDATNREIYFGPDKNEIFIDYTLTPINIGDHDHEILFVVKDVTLEVEERKRLKDKAEKDSLTGLLNQDNFKNKLSEIILQTNRKSASQIGVTHLDLDNFKEINTQVGHQSASQILKLVGQRITSCLNHKKDLGFRVGGDEFAIIFTDYQPGTLDAIVTRLFNRISEPYVIEEDNKKSIVHVTFSGGIATYSSKQNKSIERLYKEADDATYFAKDNGKNCFFFYKSNGKFRPGQACMP